MGFFIEENWKGRIRNNDSMERQYVIVHDGVGASDDTTAATALFNYLAILGNIPGIDVANFPQYDIGVEELVGFNPVTFTGFGKWKIIVGRYLEAPKPNREDTFSFQYSGSAKNYHADLAIATDLKASIPFKWGLPGAKETDFSDFFSFINVENDNGEWKVKGVDVAPPPTVFQLNWAVPNSQFDSQYQVDLMDMLGSTSQTAFKLFGHTFKASELFFSSVSGTKRTDKDWVVNVGFGYEKDQSEEGNERPVFGGAFTIPVKGHRYVWTFSAPKWDATKKKNDLRGKGSAIYVEQVWPEYDWTKTRLNALQTMQME